MRTINIEPYLRSLIITWRLPDVYVGVVVPAGTGLVCVRQCASVLVPATVHPGTPESAMHHPNELGIACRSVLRIYNPPDAGELLMCPGRARDILPICSLARANTILTDTEKQEDSVWLLLLFLLSWTLVGNRWAHPRWIFLTCTCCTLVSLSYGYSYVPFGRITVTVIRETVLHGILFYSVIKRCIYVEIYYILVLNEL